MPEYLYSCSFCGRKVSLKRNVDQRNDPLLCECGSPTERVLTIPNHNFGYSRKGDDIEDYQFKHLFKD